MDLPFFSLLGTAVLFAGMLVCGEAGRRLGIWRAARDPEGAWRGVGVVDAAVFGLLGLVIAFTFSSAVTRFDDRRNLIVQEINAIGTAYLRIDVLPADSQPALREAFRAYLDSRIRSYRLLPDVAAAMAEFENSQRLESEIWRLALAAAHGSRPATMLVLPALNEMFDITTTRVLATRLHPPPVIFAMLFGLALVCSALAGYSMAQSKSRSWLHMVAFAFVTTFALYVILDIEFPRFGLIRVTAADQELADLRRTMR